MTASRRKFLIRSATLSAALLLPAGRVIAQPRFTQNPFSLGVASGYPQSDSVVLWTRLAPDPLNGGGMPEAPVALRCIPQLSLHSSQGHARPSALCRTAVASCFTNKATALAAGGTGCGYLEMVHSKCSIKASLES